MEQPKNKLVVTKPKTWLAELKTNTQAALSVIAHVSPEALENKLHDRKKIVERIDSLNRSLEYFNNYRPTRDANVQEEVAPRGCCIIQILGELEETRTKLAEIPRTYTIGELYRKDAEKLKDCLVLIVNDLRLFFDVKQMITTDGIYSVTEMIIAKYKGLTVEEIAICLNQAKMGDSGTVYNRIDGMVILSWIKQYTEEKRARDMERNYSDQVHSKIGADPHRPAALTNSALLNEAYVKVYQSFPQKPNMSNSSGIVE